MEAVITPKVKYQNSLGQETMKALVFKDVGKLVLEQRPIPKVTQPG